MKINAKRKMSRWTPKCQELLEAINKHAGLDECISYMYTVAVWKNQDVMPLANLANGEPIQKVYEEFGNGVGIKEWQDALVHTLDILEHCARHVIQTRKQIDMGAAALMLLPENVVEVLMERGVSNLIYLKGCTIEELVEMVDGDVVAARLMHSYCVELGVEIKLDPAKSIKSVKMGDCDPLEQKVDDGGIEILT